MTPEGKEGLIRLGWLAPDTLEGVKMYSECAKEVQTEGSQTQVVKKLEELSLACEDLDKAISDLEGRMDVVLRSSTPKVKDAEGEVRQPLVLLAERLNKISVSIRLSTNRILGIRNRMEL